MNDKKADTGHTDIHDTDRLSVVPSLGAGPRTRDSHPNQGNCESGRVTLPEVSVCGLDTALHI